MAVKLKKIKSETRTLEPIMFGSDSLNVRYYANVYTPRFEELSRRRRANNSEQTAGEALGLMVVPLLYSWDLSDEYEVGCMSVITEQIENTGTEDVPVYLEPEIDDMPFNYFDAVTDAFCEMPRETMVSNSDGLYQINRFIPNGETREHTVPITVTGLSNVPMVVMSELLKRIGDAMTPGEAMNSSSEESSFTDEV